MSEEGVTNDPAKIEAIECISEKDLMENDSVTPSAGEIRSFLGMVVYYQHFRDNCSSMDKPLFQLLTGKKRPRIVRGVKPLKRSRTLSPTDWTVHKIRSDNLPSPVLSVCSLVSDDSSVSAVLSDECASKVDAHDDPTVTETPTKLLLRESNGQDGF